MKISNKNEAFEVIKKLTANGFEAYLAGGCVRDELCGKQPTDYDVATSARPEEVEKIFPRTLSFAKKYGVTNILFHDKVIVETTTFRKEFEYLDSRRPAIIEFGTLTDDFIRRDFTINALYKDVINDRIIDLCGGINDLNNKILKCVGNPFERFREDKLRILRAVRFSGSMDLKIENETYNALKHYKKELCSISYERINEELTKMITKKNALRCLKILDESELLKEIIPELSACKGVEQTPIHHPEGDVFVHTLKMFEFPDYPISKELAFSMILHDVGKALTQEITSEKITFYGHEKKSQELSEIILRKLRFSKKEVNEISYIVGNHMRFMHCQTMKTSTLKKLILSKTFDTELELHKFDCLASHGNIDNYEFLLKKKHEYMNQKTLPPPLINGNDLIKSGLVPSPEFKVILKKIYNMQLEGKLSTKNEAMDKVALLAEKKQNENQ